MWLFSESNEQRGVFDKGLDHSRSRKPDAGLFEKLKVGRFNLSYLLSLPGSLNKSDQGEVPGDVESQDCNPTALFILCIDDRLNS